MSNWNTDRLKRECQAPGLITPSKKNECHDVITCLAKWGINQLA